MGLVRHTTEHHDDAAPDAVVAALDSDDPETRRSGALHLNVQPGSVDALLNHVADEPDPAARDAMLTVLAAEDSDLVARGLIRHLASEDAGLRNAVVDVLAMMTQAVPALLPQLTTSPDSDVRILTAMLLANMAHPAVLPALEAMIADDLHPNVVAAAIDALLPIATARHVALLEGVLSRFPEDPFLRFTIQAAIPRLVGNDQ
jgi:HEAT repeat protein